MESPHLEMTRSKLKPEAEAKKEKAKKAYQSRFDRISSSISADLAEYKKLLANGDFEDKEGEKEGSGEKRKNAMQAKISTAMGRAEKMKTILDSGEDIPEIQEEIQTEYIYTNPKTGQVERQETITLNIEEKLQIFTDFYQEMDINLPPNFEEEIKEIWERNADDIQASIEEKGFDDVLIVPAGLNLGELSEKLKMQNGYYDYIKSSSNVQNLKGIPLTSSGTDKSRIILIHKSQELDDYPELQATLGVKAQDTIPDESLSLEDYLIFQRAYFKETGKHLDEKKWTWTPRTKSGSRFVGSSWGRGGGRLDVHARGAGDSVPGLGCRPSRYFTSE